MLKIVYPKTCLHLLTAINSNGCTHIISAENNCETVFWLKPHLCKAKFSTKTRVNKQENKQNLQYLKDCDIKNIFSFTDLSYTSLIYYSIYKGNFTLCATQNLTIDTHLNSCRNRNQNIRIKYEEVFIVKFIK